MSAGAQPAAWAERVAWLVLGAGSLVLLATIVVAVPPNMDEYVHYHPIACRAFPLATEHELRAGCDGRLDLRVLGTWLPLRSYRYAGASAAAWYLPLWALWPSRHGARLLGVGSLLLTALGLARLARLPWGVAWLLCATCLPVAFLLVVDTGPVGYQVALSVWALVLLRFLLTTAPGGRALATSALLGLLLFVAIEQKPFFVYQLPAIGFLALVLARLPGDACGAASGRGVGPRLLVLAPMLAVLATLLCLLLGAETRRGYPYLYDLSRVGGWISPLDLAGQLAHLRDSRLLQYLTDFRTVGHRVYGFHPPAFAPATALYWLAVASLAAAALRVDARPRRLALLFAASGGAFFGTLLLVNLNRLTWGGHHVVGAFTFLLVGLALALRAPWAAGRRCAVLAFLAVALLASGSTLRGIVARPPYPLSSWDLVAIHEHLDAPDGLARDHVVVALDWGSYYVKSLYGPREQLVVYVEPLRDAAELRRLRALARRHGRKLAFVRRRETSADAALLAAELPTLARRDVPGVARDAEWQLWVEE